MVLTQFAQTVTSTDPWIAWATALGAIALAITTLCNTYIQIMAKREAKRVAEEAKVALIEANEEAKERADKIALDLKLAAEKTQKAANAVADRAKEVKSALEESNLLTNTKLDESIKLGSATHTLVNSNYGAQLKIALVALDSLYEARPTEFNKKAADTAKRLLAEHEAKQQIVDSGKEVKI